MNILCPHCQNRVVSEHLGTGEVHCPACGSSFHLNRESTSDWKPSSPKKLGRFELIEQVGVGAFGTVYKARDTQLDRIVAIKIPRGGQVGSSRLVILWDLESKSPTDAAVFLRDLDLSTVAITRDGRWVVAGSRNSTHLWDLNLDAQLARARTLAGRELTPEERKLYMLGDSPTVE